MSSLKKYTKNLIPGIITGGADNDPAGITTYSISGAVFGYTQLWLMVIATPMLIAVQSMCARIGNVKRQGLSTLLRVHFSPLVSYLAAFVLIVSNIFTIGADILAVSLAMELLTHVAMKFWVLPVTLAIWYIVVFKNYKTIAKFFLWMVVFFVAYIFAAVLAKPDWGVVLKNLVVPNIAGMHAEYFVAAVGILGTTITPYLFFWQVKEEQEDRKSALEARREAMHEDRVNAPGFIFSQAIAIFIMIATGATIFGSGSGIHTAADAAKALAPVAGSWASVLFAIGVIGAGFLAIPILAVSTAYVVAETFQFRHKSLNDKLNTAKGFYGVVTLSLLAGITILTIGTDPLRALYYSQVLAGLLAPILLVMILVLCNRKAVMGEFRNGWFDNFFGTLALVIMVVAGVLMFAV